MQETSPTTPERHLLVAVLRRALFDYVQGSNLEREAARDWLFDEDDRAIFTYRWICTHLGMEPESILSRLRRRKTKTRLVAAAA